MTAKGSLLAAFDGELASGPPTPNSDPPAMLRWKSGLISRESNFHCILVRLGASLDQVHDDIFLAMPDQCKTHQISIRDVARLGPRKTIEQFEAIWATFVEKFGL
jgi:hypothetical protein